VDAWNLKPLREQGAERAHERGGDHEVGAFCALQNRGRDSAAGPAYHLKRPAHESDRVAAAREQRLGLGRAKLLNHINRHRVELDAAPAGERGEIPWRNEARRVAAQGQGGRERDRRLDVATRAIGQHGDLHG
jgi:hypothetical protein